MTALGLRCYECGHEYGYIGSQPHSGQCPACDSYCVSPAGELMVTDLKQWHNATGLSKLWVYTMDEQGRQFTFEIVANDGRGKLVSVIVEGLALDPACEISLQRFPDVVSDAVAACGVPKLETKNISPA